MTEPAGIAVSGNASSCFGRQQEAAATRCARWPTRSPSGPCCPRSRAGRPTRRSRAGRRRARPRGASAALTLPRFWIGPKCLEPPYQIRAWIVPCRSQRGEHVARGVDRDGDRADAGRLSDTRWVADGACVPSWRTRYTYPPPPSKVANAPAVPACGAAAAATRAPPVSGPRSVVVQSLSGPGAMPTRTRRPDGPTYMIRSPAAQALKVVSKSGAPGHVVGGQRARVAEHAAQRRRARDRARAVERDRPAARAREEDLRRAGLAGRAGNGDGVRPRGGGVGGGDGNHRRGHRGAGEELGEEHVFHRLEDQHEARVHQGCTRHHTLHAPTGHRVDYAARCTGSWPSSRCCSPSHPPRRRAPRRSLRPRPSTAPTRR